MNKTHTIVLFPKLQVDTLAALFLLRKFGEYEFPGISEAKIDFWSDIPKGKTAEELENNGYLLIDLGGSKFDHHKHLVNRKLQYCVSELIARYLGIEDEPSLKRIIAFARRDDLEGKGTISSDPLDRAFGLSGIIMNLNRAYQDDLQKAVDIVFNIYDSFYKEERKRLVQMPEEWKKIKASGQFKMWTVTSNGGPVRIIQIATPNISLPGFLRAYLRVDIVIAKLSSGHVNIITNQNKRVDLRGVVQEIRKAEVHKNGRQLSNNVEWQSQGRLLGIEEWFYDTSANTFQNGGINPGGIPSTILSDQEIRQAVTSGLIKV